MKIYDKTAKVFTDAKNQFPMVNSCIDGMFTWRQNEMNQLQVITFNATALKSFAIMFAVQSENLWRVRFLLVITPKHGVLCFKPQQTLYKQNGLFEIPAGYNLNTALFIGLRNVPDKANIDVRVFANEFGDPMRNGVFHGIEGNVKWIKNTDTVEYSPVFDPRAGKSFRFDNRLYSANGVQEILASFVRQRTVAPPINADNDGDSSNLDDQKVLH